MAESGQRRGDYGVDGSFHRVPLRGQLAVLTPRWAGVAGRIDVRTGDITALPLDGDPAGHCDEAGLSSGAV